MEAQKIIVVDKFNGKYLISEKYRPIARALVNKYQELSHIDAESILFVEDITSVKKHKGQLVFAQISEIPEKWCDVVYQTTGQTFEYLMEIYKFNIGMMTREQIIALIYHELRHIGQDGKLIDHEINDWINMIEKLGANWNTTNGSIPDLLDEEIDWGSIEGPLNLFPGETTLRIVK